MGIAEQLGVRPYIGKATPKQRAGVDEYDLAGEIAALKAAEMVGRQWSADLSLELKALRAEIAALKTRVDVLEARNAQTVTGVMRDPNTILSNGVTRNANAERQRRYRERKKADAR